MAISKRIYELRQQYNLSQKEFAEKIGASQASVNYWENGKRIPKFEQIQKIAKAFEISVSSLIEIDTDTKEAAKLLNMDAEELAKVRYKKANEFVEEFFDIYLSFNTAEQAYLAHSMGCAFKEIINNNDDLKHELLSFLDEFLFSFANLIGLNKKIRKNITVDDMDVCVYHTKSILSIPFKIKELYHPDPCQKEDSSSTSAAAEHSEEQ